MTGEYSLLKLPQIDAAEALPVSDMMRNEQAGMRVPTQARAQLLNMRHVEDLRRGAIAEVDAVITIAHRMPFETGKCDELARLIRRIHRRKIIAPGSAGALETAAMIIHQIVQAWIALCMSSQCPCKVTLAKSSCRRALCSASSSVPLP